ncbi:MAG: ABC transporter permease [Nitrospinota bacterium]|nr:ABC transporter permease [Nitrospinota bacterium]
MLSFVLRRVSLLLPTLFGVVTVVFLMIHLIPGDPVEIMLGESAQSADKEELRRQLGLDRPLGVQYVSYLAGILQGDIGTSIHSHEPVLKEIVSRWPATAELALFAMLFAVAVSIPLGVLSAARKDTAVDKGTLVASLFGIAIPNFWLGPLLIMLFSIEFAILPVSGRGGFDSIILPAITLGTALAAILVRLTRSSILEVMGDEYIRTARAKGLNETAVYFRHALSNALIPVITVSGLQLGALLSGAVITETIFSWPGIGRLMIEAIEARDYPVVQGCVLNISACYVFVNFLVDILYGVIDPRVRVDR